MENLANIKFGDLGLPFNWRTLNLAIGFLGHLNPISALAMYVGIQCFALGTYLMPLIAEFVEQPLTHETAFGGVTRLISSDFVRSS